MAKNKRKRKEKGIVTKVANLVSADGVSLFRKRRYLLELSEDEFRDQVVRPLMLRLGYGDGRDLCGPTEAGKDVIFTTADPLGTIRLIAVQTKKGDLNLASDSGKNLVVATTQMKTAMTAAYRFGGTGKKHRPYEAILCTSGTISEQAREHIADDVSDARLHFLDRDDLIPKIDEHCPEVWLSLQAELVPYFRALVRDVEEAQESQAFSDALPTDTNTSAVTDAAFVDLQLLRITQQFKRVRGQPTTEPKFEELPVESVHTRRERLLLLTGEAGSGKSTSLRRIAYVLAKNGLALEDGYKIPVLIRAIEFARKPSTNTVDLFVEETRRLSNSSKAAFTAKDLADGKVVFLVDAIDEIPDDDTRNKVIGKLLALQSAHSKCQIVATSRDYSFVKAPEFAAFTRFSVMPINFKQAEKILDQLACKGRLPGEQSKELIRRLQSIHGMDLNPLLVTVFAATSDYARKDVPANITELFKKFTEMMLGRWDQTKGLGQQYHAPLKDFLLRTIAFEMHRDRKTSVDVELFKTTVTNLLTERGREADTAILVDELVNRSGLFRITGTTLEFRHHLLQEFFAGRGIPPDAAVEIYAGDEWWQRALIFYFGEHPDDATTVTRLAEGLHLRNADETLVASVTVGLSLQACYLVAVEKKLSPFAQVIKGLSGGFEDFSKRIEESKTPLSQFVWYYLSGRDAVATDLLASNLDAIKSHFSTGSLFPRQAELEEFWVIAGLIESGNFAEAEAHIHTFKPEDFRLSLALYLGCLLALQAKVLPNAERKRADRCCGILAPRIAPLREKLLKEVRTELLELKKGQIVCVDPRTPPVNTKFVESRTATKPS